MVSADLHAITWGDFPVGKWVGHAAEKGKPRRRDDLLRCRCTQNDSEIRRRVARDRRRAEENFSELADDVEGSAPASLVEDVDEDVAHEGDAVADAGLVLLIRGGLEGPVDEHGAAFDVRERDEAPEAAVGRLGAVVAHGEDGAGGDDEVAVDDVVGQVDGPLSCIAGAGGLLDAGEIGGEVVSVGDVGVAGVSVVAGHAGVGLVLRDAVEVDDAVLEVDVVAGDADAALNEDEVGSFRVWLEEDDNVAAAGLAIVDEGKPTRGRCKRDTVDEDVVADEQGLLHGAGGNFEVLEDEGHNEEADRKHGADGG
jgi:hypothetical protein